jgi:hypothetical protein
MNVDEIRVYENLSVKFSPAPSNAPPVRVCLPDGTVYLVAIDENFDSIAARTAERVRNRRQWRKLSSARDYMVEISKRYFADFGPEPDQQLKKIAKARVVEIQIPQGTGDSAFIFPWEFAVSEITAPFRGSRPVLVLRYLVGAPNPSFPVLPRIRSWYRKALPEQGASLLKLPDQPSGRRAITDHFRTGGKRCHQRRRQAPVGELQLL